MTDNLDILVEQVRAGVPANEVLDFFFEVELDEKAPKDPYDRALFRIQAMLDRGWDAEKHTLIRVKKITNKAKLVGLLKAAKAVGLKKAAAAAKKKLATM